MNLNDLLLFSTGTKYYIQSSIHYYLEKLSTFFSLYKENFSILPRK